MNWKSNTMKKSAAVVLALALATACSDFLEVQDPGRFTDESLNTPIALAAVANGVGLHRLFTVTRGGGTHCGGGESGETDAGVERARERVVPDESRAFPGVPAERDGSDYEGPVRDAGVQMHAPVVLVGHSYGGVVVTNAGTGGGEVGALVYVNAFIPDVGETVFDILGDSGSALAVPDPTTVLDLVGYPGAPEGDVEAFLKPEVVHESFAQDLPRPTDG